jgi:hypothetical protein
MHREVGVALAVARCSVSENAEYRTTCPSCSCSLPNGKGRSDLASSVERRGAHRHLAGACAHQRAFDADHIADVEQLRELRERASPISSRRKYSCMRPSCIGRCANAVFPCLRHDDQRPATRTRSLPPAIA